MKKKPVNNFDNMFVIKITAGQCVIHNKLYKASKYKITVTKKRTAIQLRAPHTETGSLEVGT